MSRKSHCPPCPGIPCFKQSDDPPGNKRPPCNPDNIPFTERRKIVDVSNKSCLPNSPIDCGCPDTPDPGNIPVQDDYQTYNVPSLGGAGDLPNNFRPNYPTQDYEDHQATVPYESQPQTDEYKRADESQFPPCYLPQPNDEIMEKKKQNEQDIRRTGYPMGAGPMGQRITAVDWRRNNRDLLSRTCNALMHVKRTENDCKNTMMRAYAIIDKTQGASTQSVRERSQLVTKWKCTLERAIEAMIEEITELAAERIRLKQSLVVLGMPYSIATECLQRRATRPESERIFDQPEVEMYKELDLIENIRNILNKTLADVEAQQEENLKARQRLEMDWSDKTVSNEIETLNVALNNHATTTLFYPGATRFPADQSSEEYWEHFSKGILDGAEKTRQKSIGLRSTLNGILMNAARDLRNQADVVELAFTARINCMEEVESRLTNELKDCLQKLADTERLIEKMTQGIASLDAGMKVAQTRLDNRSRRPNVENCRDTTQNAIIEEVGIIQSGMSAMKSAADEAENTKQMLMQNRTELEKEIMLKRRTILMDRERCMLIRSHFPSAAQLTGYSKA